MSQFYFNDVAASAYGLVIGTVTGWLDSPAVSVPTAIIPGRAGATVSGTAREQTRAIGMSGYVRGTNPADVRAKYELLKVATRTGTVKLAMPDGRARHIYAVRDSIIAPSVVGQFVQKDLPVDMKFTAFDPYFYDDSLSSVVAPAALPMGTAPVRPVLTMTGTSVTTPIFTLRDYAGVIVGQMTFASLVLTSGDTLVIDCAAKTVRKNGVNVLSFLTAGDFLKIDPAVHANFSASSWPYVTVNATGLTTTYRRAWE